MESLKQKLIRSNANPTHFPLHTHGKIGPTFPFQFNECTLFFDVNIDINISFRLQTFRSKKEDTQKPRF